MHAVEFLSNNKTNLPFSAGSWFREGEVADHTACTQMDTRPGATHSGDHKWTGLAYNKLTELGRSRTLRGNIIQLGFCQVRPLAAKMSSTCVFVYSIPYVVGYKHSIMWSVCGKAIAATCFDIWKVCDRLWSTKYYTSAVLLMFWTLKAQLLPGSFSGPGFLIAANNFHNYVPLGSPSVNALMFKQVGNNFFSLLCLTPPRKQGRDKRVPYWHHFSHYWIKTNTDVSLIRFQQMSCFIWHCIPGLTWNNLILLPWIIPLHWLIFSPGYFSCISLGMASSTSVLQL